MPTPSTCGGLASALSTYYVGADALSVPITLTRTDGGNGSLQINYQSVDGTASHSTDFVPVNASATLPDGTTRYSFDVALRTQPQAPSTFTIQVNVAGCNEPLSIPVQILPRNSEFPTVVYPFMVRRPIDSNGSNAWTSFLDAGQSRQQMVRVIASSDEWRADTVASFYTTYLQRPIDASAKAYWLQEMNSGLTLQEIEAAVAGSNEFIQLHSSGVVSAANHDFVEALFQKALNRPADPGALEYFTQQLNRGASPVIVAQTVLASNEFTNDEVLQIYDQFLCRAADAGGLNHWAAALEQGTAYEDVLAAIAGSDEFFNTWVPEKLPAPVPAPPPPSPPPPSPISTSDTTGTWQGQFSETNPLETISGTMTVVVSAHPNFTPVVTGSITLNSDTESMTGSVAGTSFVFNVVPPAGFSLEQFTGDVIGNTMTGKINITDDAGGQTNGGFTLTKIG